MWNEHSASISAMFLYPLLDWTTSSSAIIMEITTTLHSLIISQKWSFYFRMFHPLYCPLNNPWNFKHWQIGWQKGRSWAKTEVVGSVHVSFILDYIFDSVFYVSLNSHNTKLKNGEVCWGSLHTYSDCLSRKLQGKVLRFLITAWIMSEINKVRFRDHCFTVFMHVFFQQKNDDPTSSGPKSKEISPAALDGKNCWWDSSI